MHEELLTDPQLAPEQKKWKMNLCSLQNSFHTIMYGM